ncbi:serine hydrolase-like protein [Rhipicephalus microplus]|uniref:serine hydrolase-like protein n=1 Tax=Rhipicephalus microplus TaxID=6941 RepID=UPI003F6A7F2C
MFRITAVSSSARQLRWLALRSLLNAQCRTTTSEASVVEREVRELQIPVPHGHLAAKQWLPTSAEDPSRRVLMIHGYLDNAGSFDPLVPWLDPRWHVVAPDLTGHGLSSHLPNGIPYTSLQFWFDIAYTIDHLGWNQCSIIGHSIGGQAGLHYSNLFPERVQNLVMIDALAPMFDQPSKLSRSVREVVEGNIRFDHKDLHKPPSYTEEEVIKLYRRSLVPGYLPDNIRTLMKRGCKLAEDDRYVMTKDARLRYIQWIRIDSSALKKYYTGYTNNLLVLMAVPGFGYASAKHKILADACAQSCRKFQVVQVEGNHHVHMTYPDVVASHIRPFLDPH